MARIARFLSHMLAILILSGAAMCGWAYIVSLRPGVSGEVLMVIGTMSFLMLVAGTVLAPCLFMAHREMAKWERRLLGLIAIFGVGLLPILGLTGF